MTKIKISTFIYLNRTLLTSDIGSGLTYPGDVSDRYEFVESTSIVFDIEESSLL